MQWLTPLISAPGEREAGGSLSLSPAWSTKCPGQPRLSFFAMQRNLVLKKKSGAEETAHALIVLSVGLVPTTIWWSTAEAPVSSLLMGCCTGAAHMNSGRHIQPVNVKNSVGKKVLAVCPAAFHLSKVRLPSKQVKCGPGTFNTFKSVSEVKSTCCSCRRPGSVLSTQTVTLN